MFGNHAVCATPTRACAAMTALCAADTSGRRVSTVDGTPGGITGSAVPQSSGRMPKLEAESPTSTASACSTWARWRSSASASDSVDDTSVCTRATSSSAMSPACWRRCVRRSVSR
ncbi:hypothetical protein D9M72_249050 [compost metagenome]